MSIHRKTTLPHPIIALIPIVVLIVLVALAVYLFGGDGVRAHVRAAP